MIRTATDFLKAGEPWPPPHETERMNSYIKRSHMLMGRHEEIFSLTSAPQPVSLTSVLRFTTPWTGGTFLNSKRMVWTRISPPVSFLVGMIYSNLVFATGVAPKVEGESTTDPQKRVDDFIERSFFHRLNLEQAITASALGDAVYELYLRDNLCYAEYVDPQWYFPVFALGRRWLKEVVIAWTVPGDGNKLYLRVKWYPGDGSLQHQAWEVSGGRLYQRAALRLTDGEDTAETETLPASLNRTIPVIHVPNFTLGGAWGLPDVCCGTEGFVDEWGNRLSQTRHVLDKHANPKLAGSETLMEPEAGTGEDVVDTTKGFIPLRDGEPEPRYLTWDGQLTASWEEIKLIATMVSLATDLPVSVFLPDAKVGDASAKRLRLEFWAAIHRTSRKRLYFDPALKQLLLMAQQFEGAKALPIGDLGWSDGLPVDESEEIQNQTERLAAGNQTLAGSIMAIEGCDQAAADAKAKQCQAEKGAQRKADAEEMFARFGSDRSAQENNGEEEETEEEA